MYDAQLDINGVIVPNPNYNSKTKYGRQQSKSVRSYSADDLSRANAANKFLTDFASGAITQSEATFTGTDVKGYNKYGVGVGTNTTLEDLNRTRAQNQSGWEQFGRSLSQIAINEVFLGTLLGFSDLIDWMANLGKEYGEDDWNNSFGKAITDAQDKIREDLAIYRENPGKAWDVSDAAWWWDNFVNVGSTLSLMLPSMAIAGGLSKVGKLTKLDRLLHKGGTKLANTAIKMGAKHPFIALNALEKGSKVAVPAVISRQMEDMLEGREVYKNTHNEVMNNFSNMSDEEKQQFYERNKDICYDKDGNLKSDEQIANYIADRAAEYTFKNDFKYILFDFLQWNSILRFGSKPITKATSSAQIQALKNISVGVEKAAENAAKSVTKSQLIKDGLKFYADHPKIALLNFASNVEIMEGAEEIGQGITQQNAENTYKRLFNPNYTNHIIASQLADPMIWEQGFWGMIGGTVFKGAGKAFKKGKNYLIKKSSNGKITDEDIERLENNEEHIRLEEINSRVTNSKILEAKLKLWSEGYNPEITIYDNNGKKVDVDYTNTEQFTKMTPEEKGLIFDKIINNYIINLVTGAINVGNGELLEAFITSEEFNKYLNRIASNNISTKELQDKMINRFKEVKNEYYRNLNTVFGSLDVESEYIGQLIASLMTYSATNIADFEKESNRLDNDISSKVIDQSLYLDTLEKERIAEVNKQISEIQKELAEQKAKLNNKEINKSFIESKIKEYNKLLTELYKIGDIGKQYQLLSKERLTDLGKNIEKDIDETSKLYYELSNAQIQSLDERLKDKTIPNNVKELIARKVKAETQIAFDKAMLLETQEELEQTYNDFVAAHMEIANSRFNEAKNDIINYIQSSENPQQAYESLFDGTAPKNIAEDFSLFRIGDEHYLGYQKLFELVAISQGKKVEMSEAAKNNTTENIAKQEIKQETPSVVITKDKEDSAAERVVEISSQESEADANMIAAAEPSFTGELQESPNDVIDVDITTLGYTQEMVEENERNGLLAGTVRNAYKISSSEIKTGIRKNGIQGDEYKLFINNIVDELLKNRLYKGFNKETIKTSVEKQYAGLLNSLMSRFTVEEQDGYKKVVADIEKEVQSASTKLITVEDERNSVDDFIQSYLKETKNTSNIIDVKDLLTYIVNKYDGNLSDISFLVLNYFSNAINTNTRKYTLKNPKLIAEYKSDPASFIQYLSTLRNKSSVSNGLYNQFHTQIPYRAFKVLKYINELRAGDKTVVEKIIGKSIQNIFIDTGLETLQKTNVDEEWDKYIDAYNKWIKAYEKSLSPSAQLVAFMTQNAIHFKVYDGTVSLEYLAETLKEDGTSNDFTIALLSRVEPIAIEGKNKNTAFKRIIGKHSQGLQFKVWKENNGTIKTNFDELHKNLTTTQNEDSIANKIYNMMINEQRTFTKEELELITEYFKDYITPRNNEEYADIIINNYHKGTLNQQQANELLYDYLYNIFYKYAINEGKTQEESFENYKTKLYDNYQQAYVLENTYKENEKNGKYTVVSYKNKYEFEKEFAYSRTYARNVSQKEFNLETAQLGYIDTDGRLHINGTNLSYSNTAQFTPYTLGMIIHTYEDDRTPVLAVSRKRNKLTLNNSLYKPLRKTVMYLIKECYDKGKKGDALSNLNAAIKELFGSDSVFYIAPNKGFKSFIEEFSQEVFKHKYYNDKLVDDVMNRVEFNVSIPLAKGKLNSANRFIYIDENGELKIYLQGEEGPYVIKYRNYTDFVIQNEAFEIDGVMLDGTKNTNTILLQSAVAEMININSPVEGMDTIKRVQSYKNELDKTALDVPIDTREALIKLGFGNDVVKILCGDNSGVRFLTDKFYYDANPSDDIVEGKFNKKTKKVTVTKNVFRGNSINLVQQNIGRVLIHESIHKQFNKLSKNEKTFVISHLSNLFLSFATEYITDVEVNKNNKDANAIFNSFKGTVWDISEIKAIKAGIENGAITDERLEEAMNEFLAESVSQPYLMRYLDSKEYKGNKIEITDDSYANDSIWTKIVKLIVDFYNSIKSTILENFSINNLHNSEKSSIFAEEYKLLTNIGNPTMKIKTKTSADNVQEGQQGEGTDTGTSDELDLSQFDAEETAMNEMKRNRRGDDLSAATRIIDSFDIRAEISDNNGNFDTSELQRVSDMESFLRGVDFREQAKFSLLINSAGIEYACK